MANTIYPLARQRLLEWAVGVASKPTGDADLCICGVGTGYTYDSGHEHVEDLADVVAPEMVLLNATLDGGVIDADDPQMEDMDVGQTLAALVVYLKWESDSLLVAFMDTPGDGTIPQEINSPKGLVVFPPEGICRI